MLSLVEMGEEDWWSKVTDELLFTPVSHVEPDLLPTMLCNKDLVLLLPAAFAFGLFDLKICYFNYDT